MPKRNPLNSGNPKAMDFGINLCYGNPERIHWGQWKRATTHSASRTQAAWVHYYSVNTAGCMAKNVTKEQRICKDCGKSYLPGSNRQLRCIDCQGILSRSRCKNYHERTYVRRGYNQLEKNNNNWKGGIGIFRRLIAIESCSRCGSADNLCVHHKDENRYNNEVENLECLCKRCHQLHHKCYMNLSSKSTISTSIKRYGA
jgi:hypothetical protein